MAKKLKKTKLANPNRFSIYLVIIFVLATLGYIGFRIFSSHAASQYVSILGTVRDQKGRPVGGVGIYECQNNTVHYTNNQGIYGFSVITNTAGDSVRIRPFCLHPASLPASYSNLQATNEWYPGAIQYDWQVAALNCYHNYNNCGPTKAYNTNSEVLDWDVSINDDSKYDWRVTYNDTVPPSTPHLNASVAGTSQINLSWTASTDNYSGIAGYDIYRNGTRIVSTGATSYAVGGLAAGTTYSFFVRARDGVQNPSYSSNTVSATTTRPSVPSGGNNNNNNSNPRSSSNGRSSSSSSSNSNNNSVQQGSGGALTVPSNLTANSNVVGVVLNWSLSSGGTGDISYQIDRSTNGTDWQSVTSSVFGSSYADVTSSYNTSYTYRVRAADSTGAFSDYATANVTTGTYSATPGNTITSDDGNVTATIADGAIDPDSACAIVNQSETQPINNPKTIIVQGPYLLVCRTASGDVINDFKANVAVSIKLTGQALNGHGNFKIIQTTADEVNWQDVTSKFDSKQKSLSFNITKASTFAVTGLKKTNYTRYIIISLLVIIIGAAIVLLVRKKDTLVEWFYRH